MAERVRRVVKQTKARIFDGVTQLPGKIVSLFEPHSEIIRKGKASKPTEFGKLVQVTEAENQIVTHYDVFERRPSDRELLTSAVTEQQKRLGRVPQLVTADAGYYVSFRQACVTAVTGIVRVKLSPTGDRLCLAETLRRCLKPSSSYKRSWTSGAVRRRGGPSCRSHSGRPPSTSPRSTDFSGRRTHCDWITCA